MTTRWRRVFRECGAIVDHRNTDHGTYVWICKRRRFHFGRCQASDGSKR